MRAFEVAAEWLEEGTPEARALGAEVVALIEELAADGGDLSEIAEFLDQAVKPS